MSSNNNTLLTKEELELAHLSVSKHWADNIDLTVNGVDLSDVLVYDVLQVIGRILKRGDSLVAKNGENNDSK